MYIIIPLQQKRTMKERPMKKRVASLLSASVCLFTLLFLCACNDTKNIPVEQMKVFAGEGQCSAPAKQYEDALMIQAFGKGKTPAAGQTLRFRPAKGCDLIVEPSEAVTNNGGMVSVKVKAGKQIGDQYLEVYPADAPERVLSVRFVSGLEVLSNASEREGKAGATLDSVKVRLTDADGNPRADVPVYFTSPLKLRETEVRTDAEGLAQTAVTLGGKTGIYQVNVEVPNSNMRAVPLRVMGMDIFKLLLNVLGGLALFVLGMEFMSNGLQKAAGEKMRSVLYLFSSNRFVAIIAGAIVTAVVQSSSASTVMVIGFVNAGLLSLMQSIGIIFGANIGTTITAQIISLNISAVAMPAIIIGLIMTFIKWQKLRGWGEAVLGFGILFFGLTVMSGELKAISAFPSFMNFFKTFDCAPVNGIIPIGALLGALLVGLVSTVIVQSSSAITGIVIILATSGLIDMYTGVALVLGSNVGTTITAQLAALTANRIAKQAALAHALFNIIGVIVLLLTFWIPWGKTQVPVFFAIVNLVTDGAAVPDGMQNVPRLVANAHTIFNVFATLLLLPFIPLLARICERMIPLQDKKVKYQYLEPHLLNTPALALTQSVFAIRKMLKKSWKMVDRAIQRNFIPCDTNPESYELLAKREKRIDRYQLEITDYLVKITHRSLSKSQADLVPLLMHCTNDAERIADHTEIILSLTTRLSEAEQRISDVGKNELNEIYALLEKQAKNTIASLEEYAPAQSEEAIGLEKEILKMADQFEANHITRLNAGQCSAVTGVIFIEMLAEITKISHHLSNIAERTRSVNISYRKISLEHSKVSSVPMPTEADVLPTQQYNSELTAEVEESEKHD